MADVILIFCQEFRTSNEFIIQLMCAGNDVIANFTLITFQNKKKQSQQNSFARAQHNELLSSTINLSMK